MAASSSAERQRAPVSAQVEAMLRKLDGAMLGCAPTSAQFSSDSARLRSLPLPSPSSLGGSTTLRPFCRETVADVLASSDPADRVGTANRLRFASDNETVGPAATALAASTRRAGSALPAVLGGSTLLPSDIATLADARGHLPLDAEVRKLTLQRSAGPDEHGAALFRSLADTSTLGQARAPLRDTVKIVIRASGAEPRTESTYGGEFLVTDEMREVVARRDVTHILRTDEEKRYAEEKIKTDRLMKGAGAVSGGASKAVKPAKAAK